MEGSILQGTDFVSIHTSYRSSLPQCIGSDIQNQFPKKDGLTEGRNLRSTVYILDAKMIKCKNLSVR